VDVNHQVFSFLSLSSLFFVSSLCSGVRAYWSGETFYTRNGNVLHAPKWFMQGLPDQALDGELWCGQCVNIPPISSQRINYSQNPLFFFFFWAGHNQFRKTVSIVRRKEATDDWKFVK